MQIFSVPPAGPAQVLQEDIQGLALPRMVYMDFVQIGRARVGKECRL